MKVFVICTVRNATEEYKKKLEDYVKSLEDKGIKVHFTTGIEGACNPL